MEEIAGEFDDSECFDDAYDDVEGLCDETGLAVFSLDMRVSWRTKNCSRAQRMTTAMSRDGLCSVPYA